MSLYADILRAGHGGDEQEVIAEPDGTFTVQSRLADGHPIRGIPNRDLALAITSALYLAYDNGVGAAGYS